MRLTLCVLLVFNYVVNKTDELAFGLPGPIFTLSRPPIADIRNLRYLPLQRSRATLSGSFSGAAFAMQLYLAHNSFFSGVAILSGVIYKCIEANAGSFSAILACSHGLTNLTRVFEIADKLEREKLIDPLHKLKHKRHYVEHGFNDERFNFNNGRQIAQFFGQCSKRVRYLETSAIHGIATDCCGFSCSKKVYLNTGCLNCGRSAVHEALSYLFNAKLYRPEARLSSCYGDKKIPGLYKFDQLDFVPKDKYGAPKIPMNPFGYIYIPPRCEGNSSLCTLHVAFHGCSPWQFFGKIPWHITCSGYLDVAAANNIIILFPQASMVFSNPYSILGCWDFVGYTGPLYGTKRGSQIRAVALMIARLLTPPRTNFNYYDY